MNSKRVIVIGAGPSGLATAWGLSDRGFEVDVYDAASIPGGLAGSEVVEGMTVDYGPHIYHTHDKSIEKLWKEINIDSYIDIFFTFNNFIFSLGITSFSSKQSDI